MTRALLEGLSLPPRIAAATGDFLRKLEIPRLSVIGVYLYGSAARGCYRHPASDVDMLVVIRSSCPEAVVPELTRAQAEARRSDARLDVVFATRGQVATNELPVPLDLIMPPDTKPQRSSGNRGMMFPLERQEAWDCGLALTGPPIREVVPPTPRETLRASLSWVFPHLAANFKNPELMLCRATRGFLEGRLCSKPEAARWALEAFGRRWHALIEKALAERERGGTQAVCTSEQLDGFQRACAELIQTATGVSLSKACIHNRRDEVARLANPR